MCIHTRAQVRRESPIALFLCQCKRAGSARGLSQFCSQMQNHCTLLTICRSRATHPFSLLSEPAAESLHGLPASFAGRRAFAAEVDGGETSTSAVAAAEFPRRTGGKGGKAS